MEPLTSFFAVSVILLGIGIYGLTTKRNAIRILFSVELIYNAANLNIIAFARLRNPPIVTGQVLVLFTIAATCPVPMGRLRRRAKSMMFRLAACAILP